MMKMMMMMMMIKMMIGDDDDDDGDDDDGGEDDHDDDDDKMRKMKIRLTLLSTASMILRVCMPGSMSLCRLALTLVQ